MLTGLRANNDLHLGNYFGALLPLIDTAKQKADDYEVNLFVPDLHSFTTPIDHLALKTQVLHNLKLFVAAGLPLDHPNIHIYRQSYVPAHSELAWILDCFTGMGELGRMTQYKDKAASVSGDRLSVGLFNYPVLMAADILLYGASYVPVGDDQSQHLEFARDIALRINTRFGELFTVPKSVQEQHQFFGRDQGLRVKDLADPSKKMSKSANSDKGIIFLGDTPEAASKKIMGATTDSLNNLDQLSAERQPGVYNLIQILSLLGADSSSKAEATKFSSYGDLKTAVAKAVSAFLKDFQKRLAAVDEAAILSKLQSDEAAMNSIANARLLKVQQAVGLR